MREIKLRKKILFVLFIIFILGLPFVLYLKVLPDIVSSPKVIRFAQSELEKNFNVKSTITNPVLKTELSPIIKFSIDELELTSDTGRIAALNNFSAEISLKEIFMKNIIINRLGADFVYFDYNKISDLKPQKESSKESGWNIDIFNAVLYLKEALLLYNPQEDTRLKLLAKNLQVDNTQKEKRFVHFDLTADVNKNDKELYFNIKDRNAVYFKDNHFWVEKCYLDMNKSKIFFDVKADRKRNFDIKIYSDKISVDEVITLIDSQIIENNLQEVLAYFDDLKGSFNFNLHLTNNDIAGEVNLNGVSAKIVPVSYIPLTLQRGKVLLDKNRVTLKDFKGYYNNRKENEITLSGTVDDYLKSIDTKLEVHSVVSNDFMKNYLSKMVGTEIELTGGTTKTRLDFKSKNNKIDMVWLFGVGIGKDILFDGMSLGSVDFAKGVKADMHYENDKLTLKSLDYYMLPEKFLAQEYRNKIRPILNFTGNIDFSQNGGGIKDFGFSIPKPLPSEVLNVFIGQRIFKGGKISGNMHYINGNIPILEGNLEAEKVAVPSQRLYLKDAKILAEGSTLKVSSQGGYRRSRYSVDGLIANEVKFPIVVKDINLSVDNINIETFLQSANNQNPNAIASEKFDLTPSGSAKDDDDNTPTFDIGNFVVEKCVLKVDKGNYKDINFGNLTADLTLDRASVLKISSNRFDVAEGHSSAKINCNLKKHEYNMLLGVKEVNSDIIASNLLSLPKEISGKASGFIKLNTDDTLRMNGSMKFNIKDGVIQKVGLAEYVLKMATLFRNPLTMISPLVFSDIVDIPEGRFDKVDCQFDLKDNVAERIMIKSYAEGLSSFIFGRYNINNGDSILRVYIKLSSKNKGIFGFLRNISLNRLAQSIPLSRKTYSNLYASEIEQIPQIDADDKDIQIYLMEIDGDIEHNNFISSLKKIK